ncbi:MAG: hypothetical protein R3F04_05650 [Lysobacteraceae bacterium]
MRMHAPFLTALSLFGGLSLWLLLCGTCSAQVVLNRTPVEATTWARIVAQLGFVPSQGSYWYDPRSGAWGLEGESTAGFIDAGLHVSPLPSDASRGHTGVFVNGRELSTAEVDRFGNAGIRMSKGRWWLDADGIGGIEGEGPLFNLFTLDQRERARRGMASIHDFWGKKASINALAITQAPARSTAAIFDSDQEACTIRP